MKLHISSLLNRSRSNLLLAGVLAAATIALPVSPASAQTDRNWSAEQWVGTWGTGTAGPPLPAALQTFTNQTVRLIVHTSIGGTQVRIRVSNERGTTPLVIGAAHVALRQSGADIVTGSDRVLTFSGMASITIPAGAPALSDPVELDVPALADLAVSMHLPGTVQATTIHGSAFQTNYVSLPGNFTDAAVLPTQRTITSWPFLTEVDVQAPGRAGAIVALGDSITDGAVTTLNANRRWTDVLAQRLITTRGPFLASNNGKLDKAQLQAAMRAPPAWCATGWSWPPPTRRACGQRTANARCRWAAPACRRTRLQLVLHKRTLHCTSSSMPPPIWCSATPSIAPASGTM